MGRIRFKPDDRIAVTLRLPPDLYETLRQQAYETRESMNSIILRAVQIQQDRRAVQ